VAISLDLTWFPAMDRSIAVLPFEDFEGREQPGWLTRGFAEDLTTELARFRSLQVIHAHSAFTVAAEGRADPAIGAELGARYLLRGSVRRGQDALLATTRLVEAATGRQVWADRFHLRADDVPSAQLEIAASVAHALAAHIDQDLLARARRQPLANLETYDCWLRGLEHLRRGTPEDDALAREFFERARALDPQFARAHAGISLSHFNDWTCRIWEQYDEKERLAFEAASRAAQLDPLDHVTQLILGRVLLYRRRFEQSEHHLGLALDINPNDADALVQIAIGLSYLGRPEEAQGLVERAMRLNPRHPVWYHAFLVYPCFVRRRYGEVLSHGCRAWGATGDLPAFMAAAAAHSGDRPKAAELWQAFLEDFREKITFGREPDRGEPLRWIQQVNPFRNPEELEHLTRGLLLAGMVPDPDTVQAIEPAADASPAFRREGETWTLCFQERAARFRDTKGFRDLAVLLAQPHRSVHCIELAGRTISTPSEDPVLDARARREIERRILDLQAELDGAERDHDLAAAERTRAELDELVGAFSKTLGIGQRSRRLGSASEKARSAVTWRIRSAIRKIAAAHPALGRHLDNSIRTGTFCVYEPESPVEWRIH
jgi:TolB-like protein